MAVDRRFGVAVSWVKGKKHKFYEDRYRMLSRDVPIVSTAGRGEVFGVFDGIGSAPRGMSAAQAMADGLVRFYREPDVFAPTSDGLLKLLMETNSEIRDWGCMPGTDRPLGGCAGTVVWIFSDQMTVFHAGDTTAVHIGDGRAKEIVRVHQTPDGAIFRYFGIGDSLNVDVGTIAVEESDRVLLLSDGVTKVMEPYQAAAITEEFADPGRAVETLAHRSLARGATDDITALMIQVEEIWE